MTTEPLHRLGLSRRAWSLPLVRAAILRSGPVALHVPLIDLDQYERSP